MFYKPTASNEENKLDMVKHIPRISSQWRAVAWHRARGRQTAQAKRLSRALHSSAANKICSFDVRLRSYRAAASGQAGPGFSTIAIAERRHGATAQWRTQRPGRRKFAVEEMFG